LNEVKTEGLWGTSLKKGAGSPRTGKVAKKHHLDVWIPRTLGGQRALVGYLKRTKTKERRKEEMENKCKCQGKKVYFDKPTETKKKCVARLGRWETGR